MSGDIPSTTCLFGLTHPPGKRRGKTKISESSRRFHGYPPQTKFSFVWSIRKNIPVHSVISNVDVPLYFVLRLVSWRNFFFSTVLPETRSLRTSKYCGLRTWDTHCSPNTETFENWDVDWVSRRPTWSPTTPSDTNKHLESFRATNKCLKVLEMT